MSVFSETAKAELARIRPDKACCRLAELTALSRAGATVTIGASGKHLTFRTEAATVARKIYTLLAECFGVRCEVAIVRKRRLRKNVVYMVRTVRDTDVATLVREMGTLGRGDGHVTRLCCAKAYLRGTFLGCGSVVDPEKGYHIEMVMDDEENARINSALAARLGIRLRSIERKGKTVCYLKDADSISQFLALMGASSSVLDLESIRVVREMRNGVNRLVNCETANVDKAVSASLRQGDAIRYLVKRVGLEGLPAALKDVAVARLENPDTSLKELGELLSPALSKSGVNHRMRKLMELAKENGFQAEED